MIIDRLVELKREGNTAAATLLAAVVTGRTDDAIEGLGPLTEREAAILAAFVPLAELANRSVSRAHASGDMCPAEIKAVINSAKLHRALTSAASTPENIN